MTDVINRPLKIIRFIMININVKPPGGATTSRHHFPRGAAAENPENPENALKTKMPLPRTENQKWLL